MNKLLLLAVLLCFVAINARHYGERIESETLSEDDSQADFRNARPRNIQSRHRKRRWQNYGYDYQPPPHYTDRRDYYNNQQDLIPQIYKLLEDISTYIRRNQQAPPPPPPPQPIYIPYPVPYFVPKYISCKQTGTKVNLTRRFPELDDVNQNWGFVANDLSEEQYDDSDGMRPISFEPIKPKKTMSRPAPPVEHGSSQSNIQLTTKAPVFSEQQSASNSKMPSMCSAAILTCCSIDGETEKSSCFVNVGCLNIYTKEETCTSKSISEALKAIKSTYAPVQ